MPPQKRQRGELGPEARAMATFGSVQIVLRILGEDHEFASGEDGKDVSLYIKSGRGAIGLNLTALTRDELDAIGSIFATALGLAEEVCEERDAEALRKEEAGDESGDYLWRIYRRVPEVLIRNGQVYEHDPELHLRPSWMARLDAFDTREVKRGPDIPRRRRTLLDDFGKSTGLGAEDGGP